MTESIAPAFMPGMHSKANWLQPKILSDNLLG